MIDMSATVSGYSTGLQSNPALLPEILAAARMCLVQFCGLNPGEKVLIVCEPDTDSLISGAFLSACLESKAEAAIITVPPFSAGGWIRGSPSDFVVTACREADLLVACTYFELAHSERSFYHTFFGTRTRVCSLAMAANPGCLISAAKFPMELYFEISKRVAKSLRDSKVIRFTSGLGTNLEFSNLAALTNSKPLADGDWDLFPPIGINFYSEVTNGTLYFDESTITGKSTRPFKMSIKDNLVQSIEGEVESEIDALRAFANGSYYVRHAVIGLHPKIRTMNVPQFELARAAGVVTVGLDGTGPSGKIERAGPGFSHLDCTLDTPTVTVDDEALVRNRRLLALDDRDIIEMAKSYGDPRKILAQNPFFW